MSDWKDEVLSLLHIAYYTSQQPLNRKFAYNIIDRTLRGASDILSSESTSVVNNTASVLQWCKQWSEQAVSVYFTVEQMLTEQRGGKPPTHRQITQAKNNNNKRYWTVEHEYPILIPKTGILDNNWTEAQLVDWMFEYGKATIITQEENARLISHTKDMSLAEKRYSNAGVLIVQHPYFETK